MLQNINKMMEIEKLKKFNLSYFLGENCFGYDGFQNTFGNEPTYSKLDLDKTNKMNILMLVNQTNYLNPDLSHCIVFSNLT